MKKISLKVSKTFPCTHPRKGELTMFRDKILSGEKIHTVRANYDYWKQKIDMVNAGEAVLVIEQWCGRPYHSSPESFKMLSRSSGLGVQKIELVHKIHPFVDRGNAISFGINRHMLAKNDGLLIADFESWFEKYDTKNLAIIHFTGFRY